MKPYSGRLSMFGAKAEIAFGEKGIGFDLRMVNLTQRDGYHSRHPEVARVNPKQQVAVPEFS